MGGWRGFRQAYTIGILATLPFLLLTLLLRIIGLGIFLPELALETVALILPGEFESALIQGMGEGAKYTGLAISVVVVTAVHGLVGALHPPIVRLGIRRSVALILLIVIPLALALFIVLPLLGGGLAGAGTPQGPLIAAFGLLMGYLIFAAILDYLNVDYPTTHERGLLEGRRSLLKLGVVLTIGVAITALGLQRLVSRPGRLGFDSFQALSGHEITPNEEFYLVSKNVVDPVVDSNTWRLTISGMVNNPRTLTYSELQSRVDLEEAVTLECVSNSVGGDLISTARWTGLRLSKLLQEASVQAGATWVAFGCADGYTVGLPLDRAMDPGTMVALEMNGVPLPSRHGFPTRIVVPGRYGMFHAKWLQSITLLPEEHRGFWQSKGWTNEGEVRTTAIILTPRHESVVAGSALIGGIAFAGRRGISRVEVSTDGGSTWAEATLKAPLSPYTWVLWSFDWPNSSPGVHNILARAYESDGTSQEATRSPPFPLGASGYDSIRIVVSG